MSYIHLGIDYGTSASKIVVRDFNAPGGETAYPVLYRGSYRIPSDLAVVGDRLYLGRLVGDPSVPTNATWYSSVKMRVAGRHGARLVGKPYDERQAPTGWSFDALAALNVAWLIGKAQKFATDKANGRRALQFGMTLGVPTDFRHDHNLQRAFVAIAKSGWYTARKHGPLGDDVKLTNALHEDVEEALRERVKGAADADHVDSWIRSEALASAWWSWSSPEFVGAPYVLVDIGAGTTNVAAFLLRESPVRSDGNRTEWLKEGISVLGAASGTAGMNALVAAAGGPVVNGFPILSTVLATNSDLKLALEQPYRRAFNEVFRRTGNAGTPREQWRGARVWMLGGGSLSSDVCKVFGFDPLMPAHFFKRVLFSQPPPDLQLPRTPALKPQESRISLPVAYGLSVPREELPVEIPPGDIQPIPSMTPRLPSPSLAGIYEK